ncbi:MAG: PAS domain S-box protein [Methanoregula sp.]|nr:PAS domain S-box protein [Methanoregula sp.]
MQLSAGLVKDADGRPLYYLPMIEDITERKRAEDLLRESEEKYRILAEAILDPIFVISHDDTILYVNTRAAQLLNSTPEQILKKPRKSQFPPDIADEQGRALQTVFNTGKPLGKAARVLYGDREFWQDNSLVPLKDENGNVSAILGISHDITGRKRAEEEIRTLNRDLEKRIGERTSEFAQVNEELISSKEELRQQLASLTERGRQLAESEERFRLSAKSVSDVIWDWNIPDRRLDWYGRIDEILGYAPGEFPRTIDAWEQIIHPDDRDRVTSVLDMHVKTLTPYSAEYRVIRKDGEIRYWTDKGTAMPDDQGRAYRMVGSCRDITERKKAEEERARLAAIVKYSDDAIFGKTLDGTTVTAKYLPAPASGMPP